MDRKIMTKAVFALSLAAGACLAWEHPKSCDVHQKDPKVDAVLEQLNKKTGELESYQCRIEYEYIQPLLESRSLWRGVLYYSRSGRKSALRINFNTLKQEDEKEQKNVEQYIVVDGSRLTHPNRQLNGVWLAHVDHQIEEAKYYQLAEPNDSNEPVDVFDLASKNLPMLGFSKTEDLKKQFFIELVEQKKGTSEVFTQVNLKVKPNSVYKDDYISIDFWIDKKSGLPARIRAIKTEPEPPYGDIYDIRFLKAKVNKGIDKKVFEFKIPKGFGEPEVIPLPKKGKRGHDGLGNIDP
jgi:outer membrane lipoprotein-sorting protein